MIKYHENFGMKTVSVASDSKDMFLKEFSVIKSYIGGRLWIYIHD
jgi:hypothetical protein